MYMYILSGTISWVVLKLCILERVIFALVSAISLMSFALFSNIWLYCNSSWPHPLTYMVSVYLMYPT